MTKRVWRRETGLSPPVKYFTDPSKAVLLLWIICVISVLCLSSFWLCSLLACGHLLRKGLTSWLLFVISNCVFVTFLCCILGKVWCLIVFIPDLCPFYYFTSFQMNKLRLDVTFPEMLFSILHYPLKVGDRLYRSMTKKTMALQGRETEQLQTTILSSYIGSGK